MYFGNAKYIDSDHQKPQIRRSVVSGKRLKSKVDFSKMTFTPDWYRIRRWSVKESCRESPELQFELLAMSVRGLEKLSEISIHEDVEAIGDSSDYESPAEKSEFRPNGTHFTNSTFHADSRKVVGLLVIWGYLKFLNFMDIF